MGNSNSTEVQEQKENFRTLTPEEVIYILNCIMTLNNLIYNDKVKQLPTVKINIDNLEKYIMFDDVKYRMEIYLTALKYISKYGQFFRMNINSINFLSGNLPSFYQDGNFYEFKDDDFYKDGYLQTRIY
jgi:hypothetical protein